MKGCFGQRGRPCELDAEVWGFIGDRVADLYAAEGKNTRRLRAAPSLRKRAGVKILRLCPLF